MSKSELRRHLRADRRAHVAQQPNSIRALLFHRPPAPLLEKIAPDQSIGLYHPSNDEAPANGYAKFFHEAGHTIALPYFNDRSAKMDFREHTDPFGECDLESGPFKVKQPMVQAKQIVPDILFVPLIGFTDRGERLGQGGGHYDRWLAKHSETVAIGLAWDVQLCDRLPVEAHDIALDAVVTPTRLYGPF